MGMTARMPLTFSAMIGAAGGALVYDGATRGSWPLIAAGATILACQAVFICTLYRRALTRVENLVAKKTANPPGNEIPDGEK